MAERHGGDGLASQLAELGLSVTESRVYLALLRAPLATASQLAELAEVPRPKVYGALSSLEARGLCAALSGAVSRYRPADPDSALTRLFAQREHERELASEHERGLAERLKLELPRPQAAVYVKASLSHIESVSGRTQTSEILEQMITGATEALLMIQQPPYIQAPSHWNKAELRALERGVAVRVIYSEEALDDARRYKPLLEAGAELRVLERPAMKLSVADLSEALLALRDPVTGEQGETSALIHHPDLVEAIALLFEKEWKAAKKVL
jgi:sugar-specific transcriptional regulator TrmB